MENYNGAVLADLPMIQTLHPGRKMCQPTKQKTTRGDAWWGQENMGLSCEEGTHMVDIVADSCNPSSQGTETKKEKDQNSKAKLSYMSKPCFKHELCYKYNLQLCTQFKK